MKAKFNKGSEWRVWDLHVHSPQSYGSGDYKDFIKNLSESRADVIGINDYCSLKGYEEIINQGGVPNKTIFPIVEFRMHNIVANRKNADPTKSGTKINFHLIFNNDPKIFPTILTWLNSIECFNEKGDNIQLGVAQELKKLSFDFAKIISSLKQLNLYDEHCLIWLPYDEYGGIDDIDPNDNFFKLSLVNKAHILGSSTKKQIDFFKWTDDKFTQEQYKNWLDRPKPCIKGSDAHKIDYPFGHLMNKDSQPDEKFCWINADKTFKGLKQIIVEPDRVFIGEEPELLKRIRSNKTKFIKSLSVVKIAGSAIDDVWFDNFYIEFNKSLVAIIGNKGGGKSAITDIIGLCGNTYQDPLNFSFLQKEKFRKPKPVNLSESFQATMVWEDDTSVLNKLSENPDKDLAERVKYIPQNFLERLCANIESEEFEKELKEIIYSHTPRDKRLDKDSLDELISYKSSIVIHEIQQIQNQISELNLEIVYLEKKNTEEFKKAINNHLEIKRSELKSHDSIHPIKPVETDTSDETKALVEKLSPIREGIKTLEEEIEVLNLNKTTLSISREELNRALQHYTNLDEQLKKQQLPTNEFVQILNKNNIAPDSVFNYKIDTRAVQLLIDKLTKQVKEIESLLDSENAQGKINSLNKLKEELKQGQEILGRPAKLQQKYLDDLKAWETKKKELEGNSDIEGSLKYYEAQLSYLNDTLVPELAGKTSLRRSLLSELYSKKLSLVEIRRELFLPVSKFIADFKELKERYDVKIDVALELKSFPDNFFTFINQNRSGSFCGKEEGYKRLIDIIEKTSFNDSEGFIKFAEEIIDNLKHDKRTAENVSIDINTELRKGVELNHLYDFIFKADFLQPVYNLKLGNKTLSELSPGERGALLLIFYLILDNDDIPLIIDQPEENLDNESVYHILVHFIKKVKERRQIIIVTHNPNLAIVCDADQVIHMQIEKDNKNYVKFNSGAIEDETMNKKIIDILEGTMPAFNNRDSKYVRA